MSRSLFAINPDSYSNESIGSYNNNNSNSLFILGDKVQLKSTKYNKNKTLTHKPSYLGMDQYRVQAEKFH